MSIYYHFETSGMGKFDIIDLKEKGADIHYSQTVKLGGYSIKGKAVQALYLKLMDKNPMIVNVNDDVGTGRKDLKFKCKENLILPSEDFIDILNKGINVSGYILCPERKEYFEIPNDSSLCPYIILAGNPKTIANDFKGRNIPLKEGFSELAGKWTDLESVYSETEPENYKNVTENVKYFL